MPRGSAPGERRGGRQKGTKNHASIAREREAKSTGMTPIDILLEVARYHFKRADILKKKRGSARDEAMIRAEHGLAQSAAKDAAPFIHPKLATLQSNVNLEGRLTIADLVNQSYAAPKAANENKDTPAEVEKNTALKSTE